MTSSAGLIADCGSCFGLCCVALAFERSTDFAYDKDAGEPCRNLKQDFGCGIHERLRHEGFRGCVTYDCFGAGQKVSQVSFGGTSWREAPGTTSAMFAMLPVMRQLHELLSYLQEAIALPTSATMKKQLVSAFEEIDRLTLDPVEALLDLNVEERRRGVAVLLEQASRLARGKNAPNRRGANLFGAALRRADLRRADLRGAYLIAADLRDADLRGADVIGADLRDADLRGANLSGALFLAQTQVNAARGDRRTQLPPQLARPPHWT